MCRHWFNYSCSTFNGGFGPRGAMGALGGFGGVLGISGNVVVVSSALAFRTVTDPRPVSSRNCGPPPVFPTTDALWFDSSSRSGSP
jgi:hypothetical protein